MNKINTLFKTILVLMLCYTTSLYGQFQCVGTLYVSLPPGDQYILFPEDLLAEGDLTGYTTSLSQFEFSCTDLGPNSVTLTIFENGDPVFSCTANVIVEDKINPVAICATTPTVELNEDGEHLLTAEEINNGSFDNCGPVTFSISPASLNCDSDNPTTVTMVVTDESGNTGTCSTDVLWEPFPDPTPSLACNALVTIELAFGEERTVTPEMVLEGGPYGCPFQYEVEIRENNVLRPEPIVTMDDTNKILRVDIVDLNTGNRCWGELIVVVAPGCDPVFEICDTECRTSALGDCNSGHTADDNVEWPCDISIETNCQNPELIITPENLIAEGWAVEEDASPFIVDEQCYILGESYYDQVFVTEEGKRVERTWVIINWLTGQTWEYLQIININIESLFICDTLPWNAPIGDCASGHTDIDGIEWPADITVNSPFITPDDLETNPDVNPMDVRPTLNSICNGIAIAYSDLVFTINDSTQRIERTWSVIDFYTSQIWEYTQVIIVLGDGRGSICIIRENNDPIAGVTLRPGILTDETGCYTFEETEGVLVEPSKDNDPRAGVNIVDAILLSEYLLGIAELSLNQQKAADLNRSQNVSAIDLVIMRKLLEGLEVPEMDSAWIFYERNTLLPSIDLTGSTLGHTFIGIKRGDIDNSFPLPGAAPLAEVEMTIEDEILNIKEEYTIPITLKGNTRLSGFTIKLNSIAADLQFLNVSAPYLPGFNPEENVKYTDGQVTISWIAPNEYLASGVAVAAGLPLFVLQVEPLQNGILSQSLSLETTYENVLKSTLNPVAEAITFGWEDLIISSVLNPGQSHKLQFYPNPAVDAIYFQGFKQEDHGVVNIMDATGRILSSSPLQSTLDLQWIENGMYYISVKLNSGEMYTAPLLKLKP